MVKHYGLFYLKFSGLQAFVLCGCLSRSFGVQFLVQHLFICFKGMHHDMIITLQHAILSPCYLSTWDSIPKWLHETALCLEVTKDEKLLRMGHHPSNWQCWKVSNKRRRKMGKGRGKPCQFFWEKTVPLSANSAWGSHIVRQPEEVLLSYFHCCYCPEDLSHSNLCKTGLSSGLCPFCLYSCNSHL